MSRQTPGPWSQYREVRAPHPFQGYVVRSMSECIDGMGAIVCPMVWNERDAALIAAAPDLLEALETMNAACNLADVRERDRLTAAAIPAARAAIARAREAR